MKIKKIKCQVLGINDNDNGNDSNNDDDNKLMCIYMEICFLLCLFFVYSNL